jgi:ribonuclease HI
MLMVYTDAAIQPFNPLGLATWAFIVKSKDQIIHQDTEIIGWGKGQTNNRAEMTAVLAAMLWLTKLPQARREPVIINSDAELIVRQCSGTCACNDETLSKLLDLIKQAKAKYGKSIMFRWIPRDKNKEADELSRSLYKGQEGALKFLKEHKNDLVFEGDDIPW